MRNEVTLVRADEATLTIFHSKQEAKVIDNFLRVAIGFVCVFTVLLQLEDT